MVRQTIFLLNSCHTYYNSSHCTVQDSLHCWHWWQKPLCEGNHVQLTPYNSDNPLHNPPNNTSPTMTTHYFPPISNYLSAIFCCTFHTNISVAWPSQLLNHKHPRSHCQLCIAQLLFLTLHLHRFHINLPQNKTFFFLSGTPHFTTLSPPPHLPFIVNTLFLFSHLPICQPNLPHILHPTTTPLPPPSPQSLIC